MNIIYLHGFASSPGSTKANLFRAPLEARGARYIVPDLNVPSFEKLTLTAMLAKVAKTVHACEEGPIILVGSSMGGLTALHFTDRYRDQEATRVRQLVLLAPALDFLANRNRQDAELMARWQATGEMEFFNFAHNKMMPVHYGLVTDVAQYDSYTTSIQQPILIYHGINDSSVAYHQSVRFAEQRPHVKLHLLDSDHQLLDKTDVILAAILELL